MNIPLYGLSGDHVLHTFNVGMVLPGVHVGMCKLICMIVNVSQHARVAHGCHVG